MLADNQNYQIWWDNGGAGLIWRILYSSIFHDEKIYSKNSSVMRGSQLIMYQGIWYSFSINQKTNYKTKS